MATREVDSAKIVIIGAGLAGLAAARTLIRGGVSDLLILEAQDRVGGRVHSEAHGEWMIDHGAMYAVCSDDSSLYKFIQENHLTDSNSPSYAPTTLSFYTSQGKLVDPQIVADVSKQLRYICLQGDKFVQENMEESRNFGAFIHHEFYKYLQLHSDSDEDFRVKEALFNLHKLSESTAVACYSIYDLGQRGWRENIEQGNRLTLTLTNGFQSAINLIKADIPDSCIHLDSPVRSIYWQPETFPASGLREIKTTDQSDVTQKSAERSICIVTEDGAVIQADHVIITVPLGCLKEKAPNMFKPLLPTEKLAAIYRLGFGTVNKLLLEFEKPFWGESPYGIAFAWLPDESFTFQCVEERKREEVNMNPRDVQLYLRGEWYRAIPGFHTTYGPPNMLRAYIGGVAAEIMETLPENVIIDVCHELLQRFTNRPDIPRPSRLLRSKWYSSTFQSGALMYIRAGQTSADCDILAHPLLHQQEPRVLFAGEATYCQHFGTTHGAFMSGEREGNRLLKWIRKDAEKTEGQI